MGLNNWEEFPKGKIQRFDVSVAKNYLNEKEIAQLERIVSSYLDYAEQQAMREIPMTMSDWESRLDGFLTFMDRDVLKDHGNISAKLAKLHAESEFEKYRIIQDKDYRSDFDKFVELESKSNSKKDSND